jgi:Uma2 family endonuclease
MRCLDELQKRCSIMAIAASRLPISIEQYLEAELTAPVKHEYVAGHIYAMVGTSKAHNRIAINLTAALNTHLRGGPCQVFIADIKVYVKNAAAFYYPDVVVTCDRGDSDPYVVTKPLLIVEVLSPSTERIDRAEKLRNYRQLDSLEEYVLITPETKEAEVHRRVEGLWKVEAYAGEGNIQLASVGLILAMEEVFTGV